LLEVYGEKRLGQMTLCLNVYLYIVMVVMIGRLHKYMKHVHTAKMGCEVIPAGESSRSSKYPVWRWCKDCGNVACAR